MPDPQNCTDRQWAEYLFFEDNLAGYVIEWWCHAATSCWFLAERNTVTGEFLRTLPADEVFPEARSADDVAVGGDVT